MRRKGSRFHAFSNSLFAPLKLGKASKINCFFRNMSYILGGSGIPKLYVKFRRPLFLALKP